MIAMIEPQDFIFGGHDYHIDEDGMIYDVSGEAVASVELDASAEHWIAELEGAELGGTAFSTVHVHEPNAMMMAVASVIASTYW